MIEIRHKEIKTVADEITAYNRIYETDGIRHLDSFYLWLLSLLDIQPGQTLLDVSTGEGSLAYFAAQKGAIPIGADFSASALKKGQTDYQLNGLTVSNAEALPLSDNSVDFVTNIGSVEHYFQPRVAIQEMARVLKPDGTACIFLPNGFSIFGNVKYVMQYGDVFDDGQPLQRYNTRFGWHHLLAENGLVPFKTLKHEREWPRTTADCLWYLQRPMKTLKLLITPFIPTNLANSIVYLCKPVKPKE